MPTSVVSGDGVDAMLTKLLLLGDSEEVALFVAAMLVAAGLADAIASALAEGDSTVLSLSSNVAPALALA